MRIFLYVVKRKQNTKRYLRNLRVQEQLLMLKNANFRKEKKIKERKKIKFTQFIKEYVDIVREAASRFGGLTKVIRSKT